MRRLCFAAALVLAGCGFAPDQEGGGGADAGASDAGASGGTDAGPQSPLRAVQVEIANDYAESLLGVTGALGGAKTVFFADERLQYGQAKTSTVTLSAEVNSAISWTASSMSLGTRHDFGPWTDTVPLTADPVYRVVLDYDMAKGVFVVRHAWKQ